MFNKIKNITDRKIVSNFTDLESLVNYVKDPNRDEVKDVLKAREFGKGSKEYRKIKTSFIPCVIINFTHIGYVKSSTITDSTGYMYLDIDEEDTLGNIDLNYVAAYWKSLSNKGYSLIIKVNELNPDRLKDSYKQIGEFLDVKYDPAAISKDRLTILSYDTNAFFNNDYKEIQLVGNKQTHFSNIKKPPSLCYDCNGFKIRYDNLYEMIASSQIQLSYDENGLFDLGKNNKISYSKVIVPFHKIEKGKRNVVMTSIIHQLIALNPNLPKDNMLRLAHYVNKHKMAPSLPVKTIKEAFNRKYKDRDSLEPILNASRRFLYDPEHNHTTYDKRSLTAKKIGADRVEKSKLKIREVLLKWDYKKLGKITNKKVAGNTKMNIKTVNKYCKEVKQDLEL